MNSYEVQWNSCYISLLTLCSLSEWIGEWNLTMK